MSVEVWSNPPGTFPAPPAPTQEFLDRIGFVCTMPKVWPTGVKVDNKSGGDDTCFERFVTDEERRAHQAAAHPEYVKDRDRPKNPAVSSGPVEVRIPFDKERPTGAPAGSGTVDPASEKQLAFLASLAERKGVDAPEVTSKKQASKEIERLMGLPDVQKPENFRRNKFDAPCSECGVTVPTGEGVLRKDQDTGRWVVGHLDGCPDVKLPPAVPEGFYAVEAEAGHLSFYHVKPGRKPGVVFVDLLLGGGTGGKLVRQRTPFGQRDTILNKILDAGVDRAGMLFRTEVSRCCRCGRGLSNEVSRSESMGPECRKK